MKALGPNPACVRCYEAKVKCEREYPCRRCVVQGFECLPHLSKKQATTDLISQDQKDRMLRMFNKLCPEGQEIPPETIRLLRMFMLRTRHLAHPGWIQSFEKNITSRGLTLQNISPASHQKQPAEIQQLLSDFESWAPAEILVARSTKMMPTIATVFSITAYGSTTYELNQLFSDTFCTIDQVQHDLIGRVIPEISHRLIANCDREHYLRAMFAKLVQQEADAPNLVTLTDGIYHCVTKEGRKVLCHLQRKAWMSLDGYLSSYFVAISVLPKSKYIVAEPVPAAAPRKKKKAKITSQNDAGSSTNLVPAKSDSSTVETAAPAQALLAAAAAPVRPSPASAVTAVPAAVPSIALDPVDAGVPVNILAATDDGDNLSDLIMSLLDDPSFFGGM